MNKPDKFLNWVFKNIFDDTYNMIDDQPCDLKLKDGMILEFRLCFHKFIFKSATCLLNIRNVFTQIIAK